MSRPHKIDVIVTDAAERAELEALARSPGVTIDAIYTWLTGHGYEIGRTAVHNWRSDFRETLEGVKRSAELAQSFVSVARDAGAVAVSDAAVLRLSQVLMEQSLMLESGGQIDPDDLVKLTASLKNVLQSKAQIEELRRQHEAQKQQAVEEAQKVAAAGGSAESAVQAMKKALGITAK